ncbi:MAG: hypothetical protein WB812_01490 [Woeseiaceae bacterium]
MRSKRSRQYCAGLLLAWTIGAAGCGSDAADGRSAPETSAHERGGTITVGEQVFTFVPSIQCSVYPGNVVSIAGHAAEDESTEITIDYAPDGDGPTAASIDTDGRPGSWFSIRETLQFDIEGRHVRGIATFSEYSGGTGKTAPGSFDIGC